MVRKRLVLVILFFHLQLILSCPDKHRCTKCSENIYPSICQECSYSYFDRETHSCETKNLPLIEHCLNFAKVDDNIKCIKCQLGFTLNVIGRCDRCLVDGCAVCDSDTQYCKACFDRHLLRPESNSCDVIEKCVSPNCDLCQPTRNSEECLVCKNGYALISDKFKKCVRSTFNCLVADLDNFGKCKVCRTGYFIAQNGTCPADDTNKLTLPFILCLIVATCALAFAFTQTFRKIEGPPDDAIISFA